MTACAHENTSNGNNGKETPTTEQGVTVFSSVEKGTTQSSLTRTSITHTVGGGATVFWEPGDKIWVDKGGTLKASVSSDITAKTATANFTLVGSYTDPSYTVLYMGSNSTVGDRVTIPATQTQTSANSTTHFGTSGDCGVATATGSGETYHFALAHKAAYLCLLPRTTVSSAVRGFVIQSITVTADEDIAGEYAFSLAGLGSATGTTSKTITLNVNDFPLTNVTTTPSLNAAYMVIRPQSTPVALNITYKLHNPITNVTGTLTKNIPAQKYDENKVYDIMSNLVPKDYSNEVKRYMWDAKQEYYWNKTPPYTPADRPQSKATDPDRWYNDIFVANAVSHATQSCKDCPTGVQLVWYCVFDPYEDSEELWTANGAINKGVFRFKKWAAIVAEDGGSLTTLPTFSGFPRETGGTIDNPYGRFLGVHSGLPAPSAMGKYFMVPLRMQGESGQMTYWASTTVPTATFNETAFNGMPVGYISLGGGIAWVGNDAFIQRNRNVEEGFRAMKFE